MRKNIDKFVDEITSNFADLYVETFYVRYISDYPRENLKEVFGKSNEILDIKIQKNTKCKLKNNGIN